MADSYLHIFGSYAQMYKDVRAAVDLCHRDGTLKQAVAHEPSKYDLIQAFSPSDAELFKQLLFPFLAFPVLG
jgi:hypothetical protein